MSDGEVTKLKSHLTLLRAEYVKLQEKLAEVEAKYEQVAATAGESDGDGFVARLLKTVAGLYNRQTYSDLTILLHGDESLFAHKFVLSSRSDHWEVGNLQNVTQLNLTDISYDVARCMIKWIYTGDIDIKQDDTFLLELLKVSSRFHLSDLRKRCENALVSFVTVKNCIKYYQTSEEMGAEILRAHCSLLITSHWDSFTSEDFLTLSAPLLYKMLKTKRDFPLHAAIKARREDVLMLYLMEYNSQRELKLNEVDANNDVPLDLALLLQQDSMASTLVANGADVNKRDNSGRTLFQRAIKRGDDFATGFLILHGCDVNQSADWHKESPLHMIASLSNEHTSLDTMRAMAHTAKLILEHGGDVNAQDITGSTPILTAIQSYNTCTLDVLLDCETVNLELQNSDGYTPLWVALKVEADNKGDDASSSEMYGTDSIAMRLLRHGALPNATNTETGDTLLHYAAKEGYEGAGLFLTLNGADVNAANEKGETGLHAACSQGLSRLVSLLLTKGANPNKQTNHGELSALRLQESQIYEQTPLHLAMMNKHRPVINVFLTFKANLMKTGTSDESRIVPDLGIKNSGGRTAFAIAVYDGLHDVAAHLLTAGSDVNERTAEGHTLLHESITHQDATSALFLIKYGADIEARSDETGDSALQLAVKRHMPVVVETLCHKGVQMSQADSNGVCPLWEALSSGQQDIAEILVKNHCNVNNWEEGPDGCGQTLLHRAIDENNEPVSCFLIKSGCDKNSPRRMGPQGQGGDEARDGCSPLHLACSWGQELIVQCLMEHSADVNQRDAEGKTPVHVAIYNQHHVIISLLLAHPGLDLTVKDRTAQTPFAVAMQTKNNRAAQLILNRDPAAAESVDKGRNFLHRAIEKSDIESVLFLIGVKADVNSRVQDGGHHTPLHLAVTAGSEIIVRNLLLASASVNDTNNLKQTALHLAAVKDHAQICSVLLDNGAEYDATDSNGNNALHLAVQHGNLGTIRVLLTESQINAEMENTKGQNPMHVLGQYGRENAAAIFEFFHECMPKYPIDRPDQDGNTVLLLAYMRANVNLCRAIVRLNAAFGVVNKQGLSIFSVPVATKQLLFKLLDMLSMEPPWVEGDICQDCATKFGIKTRKHHCRHCGRLLCAKCSSKDLPIIKFNQPKPVRVCDTCFDVLSFNGPLDTVQVHSTL